MLPIAFKDINSVNEYVYMSEWLSFHGEPMSSPKFELQVFINFYNFLLTRSPLINKRKKLSGSIQVHPAFEKHT